MFTAPEYRCDTHDGYSIVVKVENISVMRHFLFLIGTKRVFYKFAYCKHNSFSICMPFDVDIESCVMDICKQLCKHLCAEWCEMCRACETY